MKFCSYLLTILLFDVIIALLNIYGGRSMGTSDIREPIQKRSIEKKEKQNKAFNFQVGTKANQNIRVGFADMRAKSLGLENAKQERISVTTRENAVKALGTLDYALAKALDQQTTIGAMQSRMEHTINNLTIACENVQKSESTIRDADMAKEMTEFTKHNLLTQMAQSMLAQANQSSSSVLSLLQ